MTDDFSLIYLRLNCILLALIGETRLKTSVLFIYLQMHFTLYSLLDVYTFHNTNF